MALLMLRLLPQAGRHSGFSIPHHYPCIYITAMGSTPLLSNTTLLDHSVSSCNSSYSCFSKSQAVTPTQGQHKLYLRPATELPPVRPTLLHNLHEDQPAMPLQLAWSAP